MPIVRSESDNILTKESIVADKDTQPNFLSLLNLINTLFSVDKGGEPGSWNGRHLVMNGYHIWINNKGELRFKNEEPKNEDDGVLIKGFYENN
jgi:hypothetical protein